MALAKSQRSLRKWTKQDWGTKSGKKSSETGERYLPKAARDALSSAEYAATSRKKREDTKKGKQHSKQPKKIARKVRQFRRVGKQEGNVLTFNQQYHRDTINQNKVLLNSQGQPVTAAVNGFEYEGKIYNLPTYDRNTGKTIKDPVKFFKKEIETGKIKGYNIPFDGPIEQHPANVAARLEHDLMNQEAELALQHIGYKE